MYLIIKGESFGVAIAFRVGMAIARISKEGLVTIAILVAILWGCVFAERRLTSNAKMETYRALRQMRFLKFKHHIEPAVTPAPVPSPPGFSVRSAVG